VKYTQKGGSGEDGKNIFGQLGFHLRAV
jgi:hypothetical protein